MCAQLSLGGGSPWVGQRSAAGLLNTIYAGAGGQNSGAVPVLGSKLFALPVRLDGILLGRVVDLILDAWNGRALGLEVRCGDDEHRFLPFTAARAAAFEVTVHTPLALLDAPQLQFYAERGSSLRALRGTLLHASGRVVGRLEDVQLGADGAVRHLLVRRGAEVRELPAEGLVPA